MLGQSKRNRTAHMNYRAEIDGLRALAVIPVVLFHAGLEVFEGGFIGVDVFFVISGYLITSILKEQIHTGEFNIFRFYDRRIRRILPPLIVTSILTIVIATTFTPSDIKNVGQSLVASFAFLSNYFFYLETDYFNPFNQAAPLLHTWSLSVEEQYYILAPFIIYYTSNLKLLKYPVIISLLLISFYSSVSLTSSNSNLSFYSLHTRAWELLFGTLLAYLKYDFSEYEPDRILSEFLAFLGISSLTLSFLLFNKEIAHPSFVTIFPVVNTALLIFYSAHTKLAKKLLSNRVLVFIGLLSYSIYLLHNPIFALLDYHSNQGSIWLKLSSLPLIILLSFLSYKYIEIPSRNQAATARWAFYTIIISLIFMIVSIGYLAHSKNGFLQFYRNNFKGNPNLIVDVEAERILIKNMRSRNYPSDGEFDCKTEKCKNMLIIGDSFSEDAYMSVKALESLNYSVRRIYYDDECLKYFDEYSDIQRCADNIVDLSLLHDAHLVIITENWQESTYKYGYDFAQKIDRKYDADVFVVGTALFEDLSSFAFRLQTSDIDAVHIAKLAYENQRFDRLRISDKLKMLVSESSSIHWIEKNAYFCKQVNQTCILYDEEFNPLIWDNAHLTTRAYMSFGKFLLSNINSKLSQE